MQTPLDIGVDISKDTVMVACAGQSFAALKLPNQLSELQAWLEQLPAGSRIGMEATGTYHQMLANLANDLSFTVYLLNPKDVQRYAQGVGQRAKTDRVDAGVIARYVAKEHDRLHVWRPSSPLQQQLQTLTRRRALIVRQRSAVRAGCEGLSGLTKELKALLKGFDVLIAKIEERARALIAAEPQIEEHFKRIDEIPAVGPNVCLGVLASLMRWSLPRADSFVAYIGLDLKADDSGNRAGRRRLSKRGDPQLRHLLYMAAMSASRTAVWRPIYERALARGLARTEALIVLARHIARTAWSIYTPKTKFDPKRVQCA
jgi:transposase